MKLTLSIAMALVAGLAGQTQAQDLAWVPGKFQYRLSTQLHQKQEMMGQTQEAKRNASQHISLQLDRKDKETLAFAITLDSTKSDAPEMQSQSNKIVGKTATGTLSPSGKVLSFVAPLDSATTESDFRNLRQFFVRLPANASRGSTVVDTIADSFESQGLKINQQVVMTSTVTGDTTIDGQKAIILERQGALTMTGQGEQNGTELVLDGTGTLSGRLYYSATGGLLGGQMENNAEMSVAVPAQNMSIPITQVSSSKIERVGGK